MLRIHLQKETVRDLACSQRWRRDARARLNSTATTKQRTPRDWAGSSCRQTLCQTLCGPRRQLCACTRCSRRRALASQRCCWEVVAAASHDDVGGGFFWNAARPGSGGWPGDAVIGCGALLIAVGPAAPFCGDLVAAGGLLLLSCCWAAAGLAGSARCYRHQSQGRTAGSDAARCCACVGPRKAGAARTARSGGCPSPTGRRVGLGEHKHVRCGWVGPGWARVRQRHTRTGKTSNRQQQQQKDIGSGGSDLHSARSTQWPGLQHQPAQP